MADLKITRRHLPHWDLSGSWYFITFRLREGTLCAEERQLVLEHVRSGDKRFYSLLAATIMPDHVHVILQPKLNIPLSRIMKGIKGPSARMINQHGGKHGPLWQEESWDRIVRNEKDLHEKLNYLLNNAAKKEMVEDPWRYQTWFYNENALAAPDR
jgi:REP element-mobilizing transposase RayT